MALIVDPDQLSQGASTAVSDGVWGTPSGQTVTITSAGTNLPVLGAGDFFEVRDHSNAANNGLYVETGGTPTTGSITADKISGAAPAASSSEAVTFLGNTTTEKSVMFDTEARNVYLLEQGNLSVDGVTLQALYSFAKEEWKDDPVLIPHPFPLIAITPEQFEYVDDWNPQDNTSPTIRSRKLIRTGGWSEVAETGAVLLKQFAGLISLGTFEDPANDTAHYQVGNDPTDTGAATDVDFAGPVNEAILVYEENAGPFTTPNGFDFNNSSPDTIDRNDGGSWITDGYVVGGQITVRGATVSANDGTYKITAVTAGTLTVQAQGGGDAGLSASTDDNTAVCARNYRNAFKIFIRVRDADPNGKTYGSADLASIGITGNDDFNNRVFRFPLSNATDLKIAETDANIAANSPYTSIRVRYFDQAFNREIDSATNRDFGIVVEVDAYAGVDGSFSAAGTVLTTAEGGIPVSPALDGGTLRIHEGTDENTTFTIASTTATTITISGGSFTATESNISFTAQAASPVTATAEQIYEKIQYLLRQASDIDTTDQIVTGRTADEILSFVGDTLEAGSKIPSNPNGGGSGVCIEGFDSNDTNRLTFYDNTGTARTFPFVAAGTIAFNANLVNDAGPAKYFMFFEYTERFTNTGFGLSSPSGSTATLDSSTTDLVAELANGDFIRLSGFTNEENNGVWVLTGAPAGAGPWTAAVRKLDGDTVVAEAAGPSVSLDKNPIDSPNAILVDNNAGTDITGTIGASSVAFDFDYDNNVQGGRTAATDAAVVIRALGLDTAAPVEATGTITRNVGLSFSVVAPLERNYSNP